MAQRTLFQMISLVMVAVALSIGQPSFAATKSFKVAGAVAKPASWSVIKLRQEFAGQVKTISYTLKGTHHTAHVVPLLAVVNWSQPKINPHIKHHQLQFVVEVEGSDGYAADFSLPELLPEIGNEKVWVALDQDGKPLTDEEGPVEIVSPRDQKPARWVHGVAEINVVDMAKN